MRRHEGGYPLEPTVAEGGGDDRASRPPVSSKMLAELASPSAQLPNNRLTHASRFAESKAPAAAAAKLQGTGSLGKQQQALPLEGASPSPICVDSAPVNTEWISPVYEHLLPCSTERSWIGPRCASEGPLERAHGPEPPASPPLAAADACGEEDGNCCSASKASSSPLDSEQRMQSRLTSRAASEASDWSTSPVDGGARGSSPQPAAECPRSCSSNPIAEGPPQPGAGDAGAACRPAGKEAEGGSPGGPPGGLRRPCLILLDLDNTLIPTGWIMACWRKMQVYFGLQQAVACIRKGLEQAELVGALRSLFDDLRMLREQRHTQIVIVTNAGIRTVQEFYLKMCLPELKELCEREKVYIHSTEHFARRVGPIPPMTEEEAFCEFYTALKYHEFDFVVQRYLNALLCHAPIPLHACNQEEEGSSASRSPRAFPSEVTFDGQTEGDGGGLPPRRPAPLFCKRARLSARLEAPSASAAAAAPAAAADAEAGSSCSPAGRCDCCSEEAQVAEEKGKEEERQTHAAAQQAPDQLEEGAHRNCGCPPLQQRPGHSCCWCAADESAAAKAEKKRGAPLSLREQLQAAAAVTAAAESSSPAPSPSESPRGFDPFPLDWRCDLVSAGDQVCEIHAACRVARHFAGHVKFAKLLFLRDPEDPRFLSQTPARFIAQLQELHASLLHVISCDEETLDELGHPRWVRRGPFSQVTIVAPERLDNPPRHCAAARVRHAFEYLRRRRSRSSKTQQPASSNPPSKQREDLTVLAGADSCEQQQQAAGQIPRKQAANRQGLSCPLEWERNAVANPSSSPTLHACSEQDAAAAAGFCGCDREGLSGKQLAAVSESRSG
ncbi:hypothetical protein Efla_005251 [Eimeria flavescens]